MLAWGTVFLVFSLLSAMVAFAGLDPIVAGIASIIFGLSMAAFVILAILDTRSKRSDPLI